MRAVKFLFLIVLSFCCTSNLYAYDFQSDGIYYNIIKGTNEVYTTVVLKASMNYSGDISIPETVNGYDGNEYHVVGIGASSFASSKITSIKLPNTIRYIDQYAFSNCVQLKTLSLPSKLDSIGSSFISGSAITNISIPSSVTKIAKYAFAGSSLQSVDLSSLSNTITVIDEGLFTGCRELFSISIPNSINTIGKDAFMQCDRLTSVSLPNSITMIESQAFYNCSGLESINLPDQISSIGNSAFWGCSSLKSIIIPNTLSKIEDYVFLGCGFVSIEIPQSVTSIGKSSFSGCKNINEVYFPNSLISIGETAFSSCESLTYITLPANVSEIGKDAFKGCSSLNEVESKIEEPFETYAFSSYNSSFTGAPTNPVLYVPYGTKKKYMNCYGWGNFFKNVIEKVESYSLSIKAIGNGSVSYNGTAIRNNTISFTVNEGTNATITFSPDNGYRIKTVKVNNSAVSVSNNQYTVSNISRDTSVEVEFEAIPVTTYTLSITVSGNGSATYDGTSIREITKSFTVEEGADAIISLSPDEGYKYNIAKITGNNSHSLSSNTLTFSNIRNDLSVEIEFLAITYTLSINAIGNGSASYNGTTIRSKRSRFTVNQGSSATITFTPDDGYQIKAVKVNDTAVSVSNNQYTVSSISSDTSVEVEFEAIPPTTYTLSIKATGNGSASYEGTTIRSKTSTFTLVEGTNAKIAFSPDNGYRIKTVKVNNSAVSVSNNQYTVSNISKDTSVEVEFEAIPPTTYTLSIKATGNGSASYDGTTIRSKTSTFTVNEGTNATITFIPDNGYRIKAVKVNNTAVSVSNNQYTVSSISRDTSVEVEFEAIPPTTYTLSIKATGNGSASYDGTTIRSKTSTFTLVEGTSATITFTPDNGYRIKTVKVNNSVVSVSNNQYTVSGINKDTSVEVEFEATPPTTYTLSIKATGNGSASYDGTTIRSKTSTFTVNEGTNATITFIPDNGYRIKAVKVNNTAVSVSNNQYTVSSISKDTSVEVEFEAIPPTTYTLSIKATGNGSASYDGTTIRSKTSSFTVNEGTNATITFSPDNGYRIKSVKVNNSAVSVGNNQYTVSSISKDTSVEVEFEANPPTTYTLTIKATGNGSASYNGTTIRSKTSTFTVVEGTNATITFTSDNGYRIKAVKVNNSAVSVSNNQYTVSSISKDTSVEVEFEAIPPTTYTLSIKATGNGSASYDGTTIRSKTSSFTVNEGTNATITFSPDNGYRIKSVKVNSSAVSVSNNQYTVSNISKDTSVEVEFEAIPPTTYTLTIKATGNGSASYDGTTIRSKTSTFTVVEGTNATITFTPDNGYRIKTVKVNNSAVSVSNNQYTVSSISKDTSVEVEFEAIPPTTYTLSIKATGNGSASYDGTTIRSKTSSFTVNEGTNATITFSPDNGYRIKTVKVNSTAVSVNNNQYTVSSISKDTSVEVEFEAIPPTTYTLTIKATGNGSASYNGTTIRSKTSSFTINEGTNATITFTPDNGYRIKAVKVNSSAVSVSNNQYTVSNITKDTSVEVEFEAITYTLSIKAIGNGSASYNGTTIREETKSFTLVENSSATITFYPDNGYKIKSVKRMNTDVTSSVSNNQYTISRITIDTTIEVEFEAIPPTTYTLSIKAIGNGTASYDGTTIRSKTSTFTVVEGTNATITFTSDNGYRIKTVKVNSTAVSVNNNQYTVSNISKDTSVEVEFEAIPPTTYTLSIKATGNGSASYDGTTIRSKTSSFTVNEGTNATITFSPDNGYRIKTVKVNNTAVSVSNNQYTVSNISKDTTVEVEFEAIPPTTYTLSIKATGNGSASYDGTTIRSNTSSFTVVKGTSATITFTPDDGYHIKMVKVNSSSVSLSNNQYTVSNINKDTTVEVEFEEDLKAFTNNGVSYSVVSYDNKTVNVASADYDTVLEVPEKVTYQDVEWKVIGIDKGALVNSADLAAVVWSPQAAFTENVSNPNLLLYVQAANYAPASIKNVVVNGVADKITLMDASQGNNFYCPQEFMAREISYSHHYLMATGIGESRGWETIALPFDVQKMTHSSKGEITPIINWKNGDEKKPFWLMEFGSSGWKKVNSIKANTPYIISMPNNPYYGEEFHLNGSVTFSAENATVKRSDEVQSASHNGMTFVPNFTRQTNTEYYALNVNNDYVTYNGGATEGSRFVINLRELYPFEAYMTATASARQYFEISEGMTTGILEIDYSELIIDKYYDLQGRRVEHPVKGMYIKNGKKLINKKR